MMVGLAVWLLLRTPDYGDFCTCCYQHQGQVVTHSLELAKRFLEEVLPMALYWPSIALKSHLRWPRIGQALFRKGAAYALGMAWHISASAHLASLCLFP